MLKELLQLYTAVSLRKLASLMDLDEATVRGQLMLLKVRLPGRPGVLPAGLMARTRLLASSWTCAWPPCSASSCCSSRTPGQDLVN